MNPENNDKTIAVVGLGNMGSVLAGALINAGHKVTVWNRTPDKCDALVNKGARSAGSVAEAARAADVVIVCVTDHAASEHVIHETEVGPALKDKLLVQVSLMTAEQSQETARWAKEQGADYLEGSILSYPQDVTDGSATILYAGSREAFDANETLLYALGGGPQFVSEDVGGTVPFARLSYVFTCGLLHTFMQGAAMAHAQGISIEAYSRLIAARLPTFYSSNVKLFGEMITERNYDDVGATIKNHAAAFADTLTMCRDVGVNDALPAVIMNNFERAIAAGHGEQEMSAIFEVLIGPKSEVVP